MSAQHSRIGNFVLILSVLAIAMTITTALPSQPVAVFDFVWRPAGITVIAAIVAEAVLLTLLIGRVRSNTGVYYWFLAYNIFCFAWLAMTLFVMLSPTAEVASFWQSLSPIASLPLPLFMLYFTMSYVDDVDLPRSFNLRLIPLFAAIAFIYLAGFTNVIESHVPNQSVLEYWGYQSSPGSGQIFPLLWGFALFIISIGLLLKQLKSTFNQRKHQQIRIFMFGLIAYICLVAVDFAIYLVNPHIIPGLTFMYTAILSAVVTYGILRYGLLRVSAASQSSAILENLTEGVIGLDVNGSVEFMNTGAETLLGTGRDKIVGRSIDRFFASNHNALIKQFKERDDATASYENAAIINAERRSIPVILKMSRVTSEGGSKLAGYILVLQNISELKQKASELEREKRSVERKVLQRTQQLHEEQAKLRASIEGLSIGFALTDTQGKIIEQNHALRQILGASQLVSNIQQTSQYFEKFDLQNQYRRVTAEARPIGSENVSVGSKILRIFMGPVNTLQKGEIAIIGTVIVIEDVTESKILERSRDEFFSIASHELRTPLTAIKGNSGMLLDYFGSIFTDSDSKQMITDIHDSSERLISIVNDFLDLSRIEQGKMKFEIQEISIEPIIEAVAYEMKPVLKEKSLSLSLDTMTLDKLPKILADPSRVKQIVYNLVGNASIYTSKGGITVSAQIHERHITISVTDTGRGISDESKALLFHKFQQAGQSLYTRDTTRGTGLGLYISKLLAEKMGGYVALERSEVGVGTTFSFSLPRADKASPRQADN